MASGAGGAPVPGHDFQKTEAIVRGGPAQSPWAVVELESCMNGGRVAGKLAVQNANGEPKVKGQTQKLEPDRRAESLELIRCSSRPAEAVAALRRRSWPG